MPPTRWRLTRWLRELNSRHNRLPRRRSAPELFTSSTAGVRAGRTRMRSPCGSRHSPCGSQEQAEQRRRDDKIAACMSRRMVHRYAARPRYGASTPRLEYAAASCAKGRSRLPLGCWPCPRQGASRWSRHAGMLSRPYLLSGQAARVSLACRESWRGHGFALGFMVATFQRKQFPRRCAASSRGKFFSLSGSPLRFDRKRCGPPIPRRPDHNKDALARPCSTRKEKHHG